MLPWAGGDRPGDLNGATDTCNLTRISAKPTGHFRKPTYYHCRSLLKLSRLSISQRLSMPLEESSSEIHTTSNYISTRLLFLESVSARLPFLEYASCYWGIHAQKGLTPSIEQSAINLLSQYPESIAAEVFLKKKILVGV